MASSGYDKETLTENKCSITSISDLSSSIVPLVSSIHSLLPELLEIHRDAKSSNIDTRMVFLLHNVVPLQQMDV